MNKFKKLLAVLVCAAMVMAVMPGVALAETEGVPEGLHYKLYTDHVEIFGYNGNATEIVIPAEIEGLPVTSLNSWAFYGCTNLTNVIIPNTVISIEMEAFSGCTGLTSINIPDSVTNIGLWAFNKCSSLADVTIPDVIIP